MEENKDIIDSEENLDGATSPNSVEDMSQSTTEQPVIEDPVIEQPVIEDPVIEQPVVEPPVIEEPVIEPPVIETPDVAEWRVPPMQPQQTTTPPPYQTAQQPTTEQTQQSSAEQQTQWQRPPQPPVQQAGWGQPNQAAWQTPQQQMPPQQHQPIQPPVIPPQQPAKPTLPDHADWEFHDYGSLNGGGGGAKAKTNKKPRSANFGLKVFAIVMSGLFLLSSASFVIYAVWGGQLFNNTNGSDILISSDNENAQDTDNSEKNNSSINLKPTPSKPYGDINGDGTLSTSEIYKKVSPSVVGVAVYANQVGKVLLGQGSGIIMSQDGYIITNAHVITSDSYPISKIEVIMPNEEVFDASIIGSDLNTDLAVLKIEATNLTAAEFGDSDALTIGDRVIVIGNPNGVQFAGSLTQGVVSALNRNVYMSELQSEIEYIQTDAAINPGNSGGAFVNEYGQVVGISAAKMRVESGYEGMGFAIPINNAKEIIDSLIQNGYVSGRPRIGIEYKPISEAFANLNGIPKGLRVHSVDETTDAFAKGIIVGDIITHIDDAEVFTTETIKKALQNKKSGEKTLLTIYRVDENGKASTIKIEVTLSEMLPAGQESASSTPSE